MPPSSRHIYQTNFVLLRMVRDSKESAMSQAERFYLEFPSIPNFLW